MEENLNHIVYSKNVLEFVTVANEYCNQIEGVERLSTKDFFSVTTRILPLLYIKASMLPKIEPVLDENIQKAVREEDYVRIQHALLAKVGSHDDFLEVFVPNNDLDQKEVASSISENLTDIYQDVKDFLFAYRIGVDEIMNDALAELVDAFELYWGQKLVNVLRACHNVLYGDNNLEEEEDAQLDGSESASGDKNNDWFNKFQDQWNEDEE